MIRFVENTIMRVSEFFESKRTIGAKFGFVLGAVIGATGRAALRITGIEIPQPAWVGGAESILIDAAIVGILFAVIGWYAAPTLLTDEDIDELGSVAPEAEEKKEIRDPLVASNSVRSSEFSSSDNEEKLPRSINRQYSKADLTAELSPIINSSRPV